MFCKFCGETIRNGQKKCSRCGNDFPALSDCGGYYNVIRNTTGSNSSNNISNPAPVVQKRDFKVWAAIGILAAIVVIAIILVFVFVSKIDSLEDQINDLEHCTCEQTDVDKENFSGKLTDSSATTELIQDKTPASNQQETQTDAKEKDSADFIEETLDPNSLTDNSEEPTETGQDDSEVNNAEDSDDTSDTI